MLHFVIILFVHVSLILPIYSCTLYTHIVIQYEEKNIVIQRMLYAGKNVHAGKICKLSNDSQVDFFQYLKGRCHGNQFCLVPDFFARSKSISGSALPIFTIFAPYGKY